MLCNTVVTVYWVVVVDAAISEVLVSVLTTNLHGSTQTYRETDTAYTLSGLQIQISYTRANSYG